MEILVLDPSASEDRLLAASRVTGADLLFLQVVQQITARHGVQKLTGAMRDAVDALHAEFRLSCAASFQRRLGREQALRSIDALESAPLQRYLAARQAMAAALAHRIGALQKQMGELEI
jgi:hypothetical protein